MRTTPPTPTRDGDVKITVQNGSRLIDVADAGGQWTTIKVQADATLPKGSYRLAEAADPTRNVHPQRYGGQVLHVDPKTVYQLAPKGVVVRHDRAIFPEAPVIGQAYEVAYSRGVGTVKGALSEEQSSALQLKAGRSL